MPDPTTKLSEDDRFELAQRASMASRAAKPLMPLALGGLALVVGLIALLWTSMARAEAVRNLGSQQRTLDRVVAIEQSFAAIETRKNQGATGVHEPLPDILSRLERAATDVGMAKPAFPQDRADDQQGVIDRRLTYTVRDEPLETTLAWIDLAMQRIPGLEVHDIKLVISPSGRGGNTENSWIVTVTLARWERPS